MRRLRRLRQLVPTKFATAYRTRTEPETEWTPMFTTWWMWLGRSFHVNHTAI